MSRPLSALRVKGNRGTLVCFSDVHIGHQTHDEAKFEAALKFAREEDASIFLMGDICEMSIITGSAAGQKIVEQRLVPTEQILKVARYFKPFADKGRIVGVLRGNHEQRALRDAMLDVSELIADQLGAPYLGVGGYVRLRVGSRDYTIAAHHGRSHGANQFKELDKLADLYRDADVVMAGHTHHLGHREIYQFSLDSRGEEVIRTRHQVRTGNFLGFASYVRELAVPPGPVGCPVIRFDAKAHGIEVDTSTLRWVG